MLRNHVADVVTLTKGLQKREFGGVFHVLVLVPLEHCGPGLVVVVGFSAILWRTHDSLQRLVFEEMNERGSRGH